MLSYKQYLMEKTYDLDADVDYLYNAAGISQILDLIHNGDSKALTIILGQGDEIVLWKGSSENLKSPEAKQAHKIKPVQIRIGIFPDGSFYAPNKNMIQISINKQPYDLFMALNGDWNEIKNLIPHQLERFKNEFTISNIKGSIQHEITHWLDDVLHDGIIQKKIDKRNLLGKHNNVNHTFFEVNSQIHKIKQLKRDLGEKYTELTWIDLLKKLPSLISNFTRFRNEKEYNEFMKKFINRLIREDLMTNNLKNYPNKWEMETFTSNN